MADNFGKIIKMLDFSDPDTFYLFEILARRKDNPDMKKNARIVKKYYVNNLEYLLEKKTEMTSIACSHRARVTVRLNKRSYKKCALKMMSHIAHLIESEQYDATQDAFYKVASKYHSDPEKKWILDIDREDLENNEVHSFRALQILKSIDICLYTCGPGGPKIIAQIPSQTGVHLIIKACDLRKFKEKFPDIEVHKNTPTNVFIP